MFPCICIVFGGKLCLLCISFIERLSKTPPPRPHCSSRGGVSGERGDYDADGDGDDDDDEESKGDGVTHPERTLRDDPKDGRRKEGRKAKERTTKTLQFAPQRRRAREEEEEDEEDTNADFVVAYQ